jgi:hypothetical protein
MNGRVLMSTPQREEKRSSVWLLMSVSYFALGRSRHNKIPCLYEETLSKYTKKFLGVL